MSSDIKKPYILTYSGVKFVLRDSSVDGFKLGDIAHSLSMQCRYTGHTKLFYSVAEHCVLMSRYVEDPDCKIVALYHDAVEAYVGDLVTPLKQSLPEYKVIEEEIEQRLYTWLGYSVPPRVKKLVKMLDTRIMLRERDVLLPNGCELWIEDQVVTPLDTDIECWSPARAKKEYLKQAEKMMTLIRS
jgi:hypothetical protein